MMTTKQIISEVGNVIIGKEEVIEKVLMSIYANGHILLNDIPGVGKTTLAVAFSKILDMEFKRIQFTPDTMPSDIVGFSIYNKEKDCLEYKPGAAACNLLLGDEINRTSPKTQSALLEVMEERCITMDGQTHYLPEPFITIATQNPAGSAGTQKLPESQLDRFMICLEIGYPTAEEQLRIMETSMKREEYQLPVLLTREMLLTIQETVKHVKMVREVKEYIIALCEATRNHEMVELGVSPRGVLAVFHMAKACALVRNRKYVIPEDVQFVFEDVCAHRLVLSSRAKFEHLIARDILKEILKDTLPPQRTVDIDKKKWKLW